MTKLSRLVLRFTGLLVLMPCVQLRGAETVELAVDVYRDRVRGAWAGQIWGSRVAARFESNVPHLQLLTPAVVDDAGGPGDISRPLDLVFLETLKLRGSSVTAAQVATDLRASKHKLTHSAFAARHNLNRDIPPHRSGHPRFNPHCDDNDFQNAASVFGLVAPGLHQSASKLCDTFGGMICFGDGLYGGHFVANCYSQALVETKVNEEAIRRCLDAGLTSIHPQSDYAMLVSEIFAVHAGDPADWKTASTSLRNKWGKNDGSQGASKFDAKLNGGMVVIALLYGKGDIRETIRIASECGHDAVNNSILAGGVLGALCGLDKLPANIRTSFEKHTERKTTEIVVNIALAMQTVEKVARQVVDDSGGTAKQDGTVMTFKFPPQQARAPLELHQSNRALNSKQLQAWHQASAVVTFDGMSQWDKNWELVNCGADDAPRLKAVFGRKNVLVTHPVDKLEPAALERTLTLSAGNPRLIATVASGNDDPTVDWELRVFVNGQPIEKRTINSQGKWQEVFVDLSNFAEKTVTLRLENAPGGATPYAWETGYWASVKVVKD